ncbi:hypothetical protein CLOM_g19820 [Closterium sp. NIES-68]|nr:hypothetical protein CLOM_g19820 [Closterium sp. NIES-68]
MVSAKRLLLFLWLLAATCQCLSLRHIPPHDPEATAADDGVSSLATNVDGPLDSTTGDDSASNADVLAENPPTAVPVNPDGISNPNFFPVSSESGSATSSSDSTALYIATALGGRVPRRARLCADNPQVAAYAQMLESQQTQIASEVGVASTNVAYSYKYSTNGFAAVLTADQLRRVKRHPAVASVRASARKQLFTTDSPAFLGMNSAGSLWPANGGQAKAGEGMVIGIVDTGIWPEHPSFSDAGFSSSRPAGWSGKCETTKEFKCNNKLIGARAFYQGFKSANGMNLAGDWLSPRDANGHGTWCAGAAAGNRGVPMAGGKASGMAPAARLAMYKVFWMNKDGDTFADESDIIAAVNQAVADGVDVISLSLGGVNPMDTYFDDIAFLNANLAGVFVAFAAGNDGPPQGFRTLDNYAPFYLTVGASSIARGGLTLASSPKSSRAAAANETSVSALPSAGDSAPAVTDFSSTGPLVFPDIGTGNGLATDSILKPDIIGPGLDLFAAWPGKRVGDKGTDAQLSGTSMATPHLAGIAALIMQKYPSWSPAQVMSAIMTTATTKGVGGAAITAAFGKTATPWDMGAGHVFPPKVLDPGLTYDARKSAYLNFLAGLDMERTQQEYPNENLKSVPPRELNRPTISITSLKGTLTVTRTVTNVADSASTYSAKIQKPNGVEVTVKPSSFTVSPGKKVTFVVTFKVTKTSKSFQFGSLTWVDDKGHSVRSAIAVKPVQK